MAQEVGHYENNVTFTEGPFVISNPHGNGWRVEVELKKYKCPVLPDDSIYKIMRRLGLAGKTDNRALAARVCDDLNRMVRGGEIVCDGKWWVNKD